MDYNKARNPSVSSARLRAWVAVLNRNALACGPPHLVKTALLTHGGSVARSLNSREEYGWIAAMDELQRFQFFSSVDAQPC
jgi:hypothetical protein